MYIALWCPPDHVTPPDSRFSRTASDVAAACEGRFPTRRTHFAAVASEVERVLSLKYRLALDDRDQEWQRVNSYLADVLKDTHVLYAKLARLQGDFVGPELSELEKISEKVLDLGEELSRFMKAFHEGDASMFKQKVFGGEPGEPVPGETPPAPPERFEEDYESEIRAEEDGELSEFEEVGAEEAPAESEEAA